ncbi:MAG: DUF21 domain-containing protein [Candidatus Marinimicrobia bacterium]|nr:DUF21 domain-containing protein [Candidatus Neomarinimicrobiota bacterium]
MSFIAVEIIIFIGLLILSSFFSGSETALFSLKEHDLARMKEETGFANQRVIRLLEKPKRLLVTILTGNTIVNVAMGVIAAILATLIASEYQVNEVLAVTVQVILVTIIILLFGEITPKILAVTHSKKMSRVISFPLNLIFKILYPVASVLYNFTRFVTRILGIKKENLFLSEDEIRTLVEVSEIQGALQEQEKNMIYSIFEFGNTYVREIMIPRIDMIAAKSSSKVREVIELIKNHQFARLPVYDKRVDNINGIIFAKDLLPYTAENSTNVEIAMLSRPAYFVPEKMKIDKLLREFQQRKTNIAIVVDEYGGTAGLVTLEDIIEEIVGEIRDEYDFETPFYRWMGPNTLLVNARMTLDDLQEIVSLGLPEDEERDYDTLGGFLYSRVGDIPEEKTEIFHNDVTYFIDKVVGNRIKRVKIKIPQHILDEMTVDENSESK